jgi:hypothetical protein
MALTLTLPQTGFSSPSEEVQKDYTVVSGEWTMGRIHERRSGAGSGRRTGHDKPPRLAVAGAEGVGWT